MDTLLSTISFIVVVVFGGVVVGQFWDQSF